MHPRTQTKPLNNFDDLELEGWDTVPDFPTPSSETTEPLNSESEVNVSTVISVAPESKPTETIITPVMQEFVQQENQFNEEIIAPVTQDFTQQENQFNEEIIAPVTQDFTQQENQFNEEIIAPVTQDFTQQENQSTLDTTIINAAITENIPLLPDIYPATLPSADLSPQSEKTLPKELDLLKEMGEALKQQEECITQLKKDKEITKEITDAEFRAERDIVIRSAEKILSLQGLVKKVESDKADLKKIIENHLEIENTLKKDTMFIIHFFKDVIINSLNKKIKDKDIAINQLSTKIEDKDIAINQLNTKISDLNNLITSIKTKSHEDQKTIQSLKDTIQLKEKTLAQTQTDKHNTEQALEEKTVSLQSKNSELEKAKKHLQLTNQIFETTNKIDEMTSARNKKIQKTQEEKLATLSKKTEFLCTQNEALIKEIESLRTQNAILRKERDTTQPSPSILKEETEKPKPQEEQKQTLVETKEIPPLDLREKESEHIQKSPKKLTEEKPLYSAILKGTAKFNRMFKPKPPSYPQHQQPSNKQDRRNCFGFRCPT